MVNNRKLFSSRDPILSRHGLLTLKIAYVSFETKRPAIYLQDLSTGTREVLTSFKGLNGAPSFSPDGKSMLFTASMNGNPEIYQMDLSTRQVKRMTNDSELILKRVTPDGKAFILHLTVEALLKFIAMILGMAQ